MLEICNLSYSFNESDFLLQNLSFKIFKNGVMELNAANGSGKTTLLELLAGIRNNYLGNILWQGKKISTTKDYLDYKQNVLYIGHKNNFHMDLTPVENLTFQLRLRNIKVTVTDILASLKVFDVHDAANMLCKYLSKGQLQKVALARLSLDKAKLWLLDEPLASLDKNGITAMVSLLDEHLSNSGMAIIASHIPIDYERKLILKDLKYEEKVQIQ